MNLRLLNAVSPQKRIEYRFNFFFALAYLIANAISYGIANAIACTFFSAFLYRFLFPFLQSYRHVQLIRIPNYWFIVCVFSIFALVASPAIGQYTTGPEAKTTTSQTPLTPQQRAALAAQKAEADEPKPVTILFSGIRWKLRSASTPSEPGNNLFSNDRNEVFLDSQGKLHCKLNKRDQYWYSVELVADTALGYGTYAVFTETRLDTLPKNLMFEFGITSETGMKSYIPCDIAVQFSRLGQPVGSVNTLQYLVANTEQSIGANRKERVFRPEVPFRLSGYYSTHAFVWNGGNIEFASYHDHGLPSAYTAATWEFSGSNLSNLRVPNFTPASVMRLRLWSAGAPIDGRAFEVVLKKIQFIPAKR
jgi:hypothetical protein